MPNHFHFLIRANSATCRPVKQIPIEINAFTEGVRLLLSSYTKAIQVQESITGNLFQQKTKSKCVDDYGITAFHYIHQNPYKAGLADTIEDWNFSSIKEYLKRNAQPESSIICNKALAWQLFNLDSNTILKEAYRVLDESATEMIF